MTTLINRSIETEKYFPNIPTKFKDKFPENYRPWVQGWSVKKEELKERLPDGTLTLNQLDISISRDDYVEKVNSGFIQKKLTKTDQYKMTQIAEEKYVCEIGCKHCFECRTKTKNLLMNWEENKKLLIEAKELGLKNVKFLGPGELMHNLRLFEILDFFKENNLKLGIFTKGLVLGDDEWSQKFFNLTSKELCKKIAKYENITILLGLTSADKETESARINTKNVPNLFDIRNKAFENLAKVGLNDDINNQRLALLCVPILRDNIDEVLEIFKWGIERNIPVVGAPTMLTGKGLDMDEIQNSNFKEKKLIKLYIEIYSWLINQKIMNITQIEAEGISPYPGYACNQFIGGMFVRKDGRVQACPGNETKKFVYASDVRKQKLKDIWKNSMGYKLREQLIEKGELKLTQPCYAKSEGIKSHKGETLINCGSIPENFYSKILAELKIKFKTKI